MAKRGKNKSNVGRKSKYQTHIEPNVELILGWLRSGYTEQSIAKRLGVGASTWKHYKGQYQDFRDLIQKGQQDIAALCVNSLLKRAVGYDYEEVHKEVVNPGSQGQGRSGAQRVVVKTITKHVPADVGACCVILFNRMKGKWQNKQEIKHSGQIKNTGVLMVEPERTRKQWEEWVQQGHKTQQEKATPT